MSKRVLIFSLAYYPKMVGGAEVAIRQITDRIPEVVFDMVTLRFDSTLPKFERIGNVNVHRIGLAKKNPKPHELVKFPWYLVKVWYPVGAFLKALSLTRKNKYDTVWAMMSYMGFPALFLKWLYPKLIFVVTLQEGDKLEHVTDRTRIKLVGSLYRQIFKRADIVQTISNYLAEFAKKMGLKGRIEVISNGVTFEAFRNHSTPEENEALRKELGFTADDVLLVTTSRLVEKNAVDEIIRSLTFLDSKVKLMIIGDGPLENDLRKMTEELKLVERVKFLGYMPIESIPKHLHASDIFVRPSRSEGMGNSFIEAMAAGIPVIATTVGGIADFLVDGETGLEVGLTHTAEDIARKVEKLSKDRESRDYIVKNALKMVEKRYDWDLIAKEMKEKVFK